MLYPVIKKPMMNETSQHLDEEMDPIYRETTERFWFLRLVTEVREDGLYVRFDPIHRSFRHVSSPEIDEVRATTYSQASYGGWHWGIRWSPGGNTVYRLRGNRGVELVLNGNGQVFVGSQSPSELGTALQRVTASSEMGTQQ
jgi:hypothetical protein